MNNHEAATTSDKYFDIGMVDNVVGAVEKTHECACVLAPNTFTTTTQYCSFNHHFDIMKHSGNE